MCVARDDRSLSDYPCVRQVSEDDIDTGVCVYVCVFVCVCVCVRVFECVFVCMSVFV